MENQIRMIVLGRDFKEGMRFSLNQEVFGGNKIIAFVRTETGGIQIWITKNGEEKIWKEASGSAAFHLEYSLDY